MNDTSKDIFVRHNVDLNQHEDLGMAQHEYEQQRETAIKENGDEDDYQFGGGGKKTEQEEKTSNRNKSSKAKLTAGKPSGPQYASTTTKSGGSVKSLVGGGGGLDAPQMDQYHSSNSSPSLMQMPTEKEDNNTKSMPDADELEQNTSETIQLQDLPTNILTRIFMHLKYRERGRLESVSPARWWAMALAYAWKDQRILRFSREMLHLNEPWKDTKKINSIIEDLNRQQNKVTAKLVQDKCNDISSTVIEIREYARRLKRAQLTAMRDYRQLLTNPALYKREKTSKQLAPLKAILHRCAPFMDELHLLGAFDNQMRFGRIFSQLAHPFGRLAHLHIKVPLDSWHLRKIQRHLAPQLISLAIFPIDNNKCMVAFRELLANCNKLENLQIAEFDDDNLFDEDSTGEYQPSSSSLALTTTTSCCSFLPSTLKCLLMSTTHWCENPEKLLTRFVSLLAHCSQLRYMPILINSSHILELIAEKNPREFDKIIGLQFPLFIANHSSFPYIERPEFRNLKALHVIFKIGAEKIRQIAKCCPQLEHLSISLSHRGGNGNRNHDVVEISDLVALHQFQRLSSLEILMEHKDFEMFCHDGEGIDFLNILTELDQIHPLRSLDFKAFYYISPSLSQDYLLKMANQLTHLETFSCRLNVENLDIDDMTGIGQFCEQLEQIFNFQEGANKKSFKFRLVANGYEWDTYDIRDKKYLLVDWQKGSGTKKGKMNWHCIPTWRTYRPHEDFQPARSIVLNELITNEFGQRTSSMLFNSFGMMETIPNGANC